MRAVFTALPMALAATFVPAPAQDGISSDSVPLAACTYTVSPATTVLPFLAGTLSLTVTTGSGCVWDAASSASWLTPDTVHGTGSGTATFFVALNGNAIRSATVTIAGQTVTVFQIQNTFGSAFYPIAPCRLVDTRSFGGITGAMGPPFLKAGSTRLFQIPPGACGIPLNVAFAFSFNVTAVPHGRLGFLTVWPAYNPWPGTSTLNSPDGAVVANAAIVESAFNNSFNVTVSDDTDVIIDVDGIFAPPTAPGMLAFYPVAPCRVVDTRTYSGKAGAFGPPAMSAFETRSFPLLSGSCGIPPTAQAYSLNYTVWPYGPLMYLTTWAAGQPQPFVSTLNSYDGRVVANAAIVPAGTAGAVNVFVTDPTDVIIDVNGYFAPPVSPGALFFFPGQPCRVADTRSFGGKTGALGPPAMYAYESRSFPVLGGSCPIIPSVQAYALNITAWPEQPLLYLTAWATGQPQPFVSTLNSLGGNIVANTAIVQAGAGGAITLFATGTTDVFLDLQGYFAP